MSPRFHLGMTFLLKLNTEMYEQERYSQSQLQSQLQPELKLEQEMGQTANLWSASLLWEGWLTQTL